VKKPRVAVDDALALDREVFGGNVTAHPSVVSLIDHCGEALPVVDFDPV
jgi:hypothetical protein